MKRLMILSLILCSLCFISCDNLLSDYDSKRIPLEEENYKPQLCVYANYVHGKGLSLELSSTMSIALMQTGPEIKSAKVLLAKPNGQILFDDIVEFTITSMDYHKSKSNFIDINKFKFRPNLKDTLLLSVKVDGYDVVKGQTTIPDLVHATKLMAQKYKADEIMYRFILQFDDPKEVENYYLVSSVYYLTTIRIIQQTPTLVRYDTIPSAIRHQVPISDPVFDFMPNVRSSTKEPFDISVYKPRIFNDKGFNGSSYGLKIEVPLEVISPHDATTHIYESEYELELYSISKDLFEGYKSNYMTTVIEGDIYAEPVILYSNMSNKIGLFGAINGPSKQKTNIEKNDVLLFNPNEI
jgi:hypothetical protein